MVVFSVGNDDEGVVSGSYECVCCEGFIFRFESVLMTASRVGTREMVRLLTMWISISLMSRTRLDELLIEIW